MAYSLRPDRFRDELETYKPRVATTSVAPVQQQVASTAQPYSFKQRDDKGFDFFKGNQKTTIEDYAKGIGRETSEIRGALAGAEDKQSQEILTKRYYEKQPEVQKFNQSDVYDQRKRLSELQGLAGRTEFNSQKDIDNAKWAQGQLSAIEQAGKNQAGNPITFLQYMVGLSADTYGRLAQGGGRALDEFTVGSQRKLDDSRIKNIESMNQMRNQLIQRYSQGPVVGNVTERMSPQDRQLYEGLTERLAAQQATVNATSQKIQDEADPVKYAAAAGTAVLDLATLGAGSKLLTTAARGLVPGATQTGSKLLNFGQTVLAPQGIKQGLTSYATLGFGYGTAGTAEQLGSQATLGDYAMGGATGALLGSALGTAVPTAAKLFNAGRTALGKTGTKAQRMIDIDNQARTAAQEYSRELAQADPRVVNALETAQTKTAQANQLIDRGLSPNSPDVRLLQREAQQATQFADDTANRIANEQYQQQYNTFAKQLETEARGSDRRAGVEELRDINREVRQLVPGGTLDAPLGRTPRVLTEEQYLAQNGASFMDGAEPALQQNRIPTKRGQSDAVNSAMGRMSENNARREALRAEYKTKIASGEIVEPSSIERLIERANGLPENESTQAARRLLEKRGINLKDVIGSKTPKTARVWVKSKFSDKGGYSDYPIIRQEDNITLYQGGKANDNRQFWTPNRKYAEQFGDVREKTGSFYKIDNGNKLTDVYVEVAKSGDTPTTPSRLSRDTSPEAPTNQQGQNTPQRQLSEDLPQEVKTRLNTLADTSQRTPNAYNDTLNTPLGEVLGDLRMDATNKMPDWNAPAASARSNSAQRLADDLNQNQKLNKAAADAQQSGEEINFYAKKDKNDRSVGIERFDPRTQKIESGFVTDRDGNVLGNHIKVDKTGIQVNVGGELINMERVLGDASQWKGKYRVGETISRNIDSNAPSKEVADATKDFLVANKRAAESKYKTELKKTYDELGERIDTVKSARPSGVSKKDFNENIFALLNGDIKDSAITKKYPQSSAQTILKYKSETRNLYDSLLERINTERIKFGKQPIEGRKDYITHLQELNNKTSFTGEVARSMRNSFVDDGRQTTRGGVPGSIAGRTENFKPTSSYNPFLQRRTGTKSLRDPFLAVQEYIEPALYNIHMTEATVRARAVEAAFRTAAQLREMNLTDVTKYTDDFLKKYKDAGADGRLVAGFQEYANALAKKTQRWDRQVIDSSASADLGVRGWQGLQRAGGAATIVGNVSSVLAQPLNQVIGLSDVGVKNYLSGIARSIGRDKAIKQSDFITARRTIADKPITPATERIINAGGVPLQKVEMASIEILWNSQHAKALSKGLKGQKAIREADMNTERLVAGRGIADRPELYRSTLANGFLQYTLEVSAQNKAFWKDLTLGQKATFLVAAAGVNMVYSKVTGYEPLPDFLKAATDTGADFMAEDDERNIGDKAFAAAQRFGGEVVGMNPLGSAIANAGLDQYQRKAVFGDESSLGRFEGTAAPVQFIRNAQSGVQNLFEGDMTEARNDFLRTVPFGNQARKTITGAESLDKGYAVDRSGNATFAAPDDFYGQMQALLFGPSATGSAQEYYNGNNRGLSEKKTAVLDALPKEQRKEYLDILRDKSTTEQSEVLAQLEKDTAQNQLEFEKSFSPEDWQLYDTTKAQREALVNAGSVDEDKLKSLDSYADKIKRELGMDVTGGIGETNLDSETPAYKFLDTLPDMSDEEKTDWRNQQVSEEYTSLISQANEAAQKNDLPELPATNSVAELYSKFQQKRADNDWSDLQEQKETTKLYSEMYDTYLSDNEQFIASMSDTAILEAAEAGQVQQSEIDNIIAIDDIRVKLGLSPRIGKKARAALGYASASSSSSGTKGSRKSYKLYAFGDPSQSTTSNLRKLIEQAQL